MHVGCECNVVIATCPQRYLLSTFLRCDNVAFTTLPQPKHNVVTMLSQRDFVCWVCMPYDALRPVSILKKFVLRYQYRTVAVSLIGLLLVYS